MKENKRLIVEAIALIILLVSALIIWSNTILKERERTFKQEPLKASQVDAMMMEWEEYENEPLEFGSIISEDVYEDTIDNRLYTSHGRLIINN